MSAAALLQRLRQLGVRLRLEGEKLKISAPKGALDAGLKAELKARKDELVDLLRSAQRRVVSSQPPLTARDPQEGDLPLSFAQERLWFLQQLEPESAAYHIADAMILDGALDERALESSLRSLVWRQEVLRTRFPARDGRPVLSISPPGSLSLARVDLRRLGPAAALEQARRWVVADRARPFDLAAGPLARWALLRLEERRWVLYVNLHHTIADGGSVALFLRDLSAGYRRALRGEEGKPAPLEVQYADFALWQRRWLRGEALEEQLGYWRRQLEGLPPQLELPRDRASATAVRRGRHVRRRTLPPPRVAALHALARRLEATPFIVLLATFGVLLARLSGQRDLAIGSPRAGRRLPELEEILGLFVNTLVLRLDLGAPSGQPLSFRQLVARARNVSVEADAHQDLPFEKLVAELAPERDLARRPFFQVLMVQQDAHLATLGASSGAPQESPLPGVELAPLGGEEGEAKFDWTLAVQPGWSEEDPWHLVLEVDAELFDGTTAQRSAEALDRLLAAALEAPDRPALDLPWLSEAQRHQATVESAGVDHGTAPGTAHEPALELVHHAFFRHARTHPEAPALRYGEELLSYGHLAEASLRLARRLSARLASTERVGSGEAVVALDLPRGPQLVVALLAAFAVGVAYVPLEPEAPARRRRQILQDSGARLVLRLGQEQGAGEAEGEPPVLLLDGEPALSEGSAKGEVKEDSSSGGVFPEGAAAGSLAYVLFTSGSTGRPKGVAVEHRQLAAYTAALRRRIAEQPPWVYASVSTLAADLGHTAVFPALTSGACLDLITEEALADGARLEEHLERHPVDLLKIVPSHFSALLASSSRGAVLPQRWLVFGGEALSLRLIQEVLVASRRHAPALAEEGGLLNHYGPTETTVGVLTHRWDPRERPDPGGLLPLGRPLPGARVYTVDGEGRPVPPGASGELLLGGAGVTRGYHRRPRLTAERFLPDPWSPHPGGRIYRSGDRVRWRADGSLVFQGRVDDQVKIRGFRVEPGEVAAALEALPEISAAYVAARRAAAGGALRLVAWVVSKQDSPQREPKLEEAELRSRLAESLPAALVPSAVLWLDQLPLTANGKVDRRALPEPSAALRPAAEAEAPLSVVEELLAAQWRDLLGMEELPGRQDSFFDLGGHSLLATRAVAQARRAFGVELALKALFQAPRLGGFATAVEQAQRSGELSKVPPLEPRAAGLAPLSYAQEQLWFLDRLEPGLAAYNIPRAVRLEGDLDPLAMARTLARIAERHQVLRSRFQPLEQLESADRMSLPGEALQRVVEPPPPRLPRVDLSALPPQLAEAEAYRLAAMEADSPFDLAAGPLLRSVLLRLADRRHVLLITLHHIVSDGWSTGLLIREMGIFYDTLRGLSAQAPWRRVEVPLAPLAVQYGDYAAWQRDWLQGEELERRVEAAARRLAGVEPVLSLPLDRPRPPVLSARGALVRRRLDAASAAVLDGLARRCGATFFTVLLAAFAVLLTRWTGRRDLVVGSPAANRGRPEVQDLVGFFVNTLALRLTVDSAGEGSSAPTFEDLVALCRQQVLEVAGDQELPFDRLVQHLAPQRDLSVQPLVQVMLVLQNELPAPPALADLELGLLETEVTEARFDWTFLVTEEPAGESDGGGLLLELSYRRDLFDATTADRVLGSFARLLESAEEGAPVHRLSLLSACQEHQLRWEVNDTAVAGGRLGEAVETAPTVLHLIAHQARRDPQHRALTLGEEPVERADGLSYGELWERSGVLARGLRRRGVDRGDRVALLCRRGPQAVVAMVGCWRANAAFIPVDLEQPAVRRRLMLEDAQPRLILAGEKVSAGEEGPAGEGTPDREGRFVLLEALLREEAESEEPTWELREEGFPQPVDLAYVLYTSGSTGRPKGALIPHGGLAHLVRFKRRFFDLPLDTRASQLASLSFDAAQWELWTTLGVGLELVFAPERLRTDPAALWDWFCSQQIGFAFVPTPLAHLLFALPQVADGDSETALRWLVTAGDRLHRRPPPQAPFRLANAYGPTEATIHTTTALIEAGEGGPVPPIGRPAERQQVYVVDPWMGIAPPGASGELVVGGDAVGGGYWRQPRRTALSFVPDPFAQRIGVSGGRLYRTGDRARWRSDGQLEFLGRGDAQIKIRGVRLELGEVEAALNGLPQLREAAAAVVEAPQGRRLVGYLVPAEPVGAASESRGALLAEIRQQLLETLPEAAVPTGWGLLEALPLTPNGKVDRRALAALQEDALDLAAGEASTPLDGPLEEAVGAVWREVLGIAEVGAEDDFFARGGHSLLAARAAARLESVAGGSVPIAWIFEHRTPRRLAAAMAAPADRPPPPPVTPRDSSEEALASFAQERLWLLDRLDPGSAVYNIPWSARLQGPLNHRALATALAAVAVRHQSLRTDFLAPSAQRPEASPRQRIAALPSGPLRLPVIDLRGLPEPPAAARRILSQVARRPFRLDRGPLYRGVVIRLGSSLHHLAFCLHHTIADGWSMGLFARELSALYEICADENMEAERSGAEAWSLLGEAANLPALPVQYPDYAAWQRQWLGGGELELQLGWWKEALAGVPEETRLPLDRPRPPVRSAAGALRTRRWPLGAALDARARALGTTPFVLWTVAWAAVLHRWGSASTLALGTPVAGRRRPELEPLIGFFVNTLVLRLELKGNPSLGTVVDRARRFVLEALAHQDIPFEELVQALAPQRDLSQTPLFQAMVAYQGFDAEELTLPGVAVEPQEVSSAVAKFDLTLVVSRDGDRVRASLEYATALFDGPTVDRLLSALGRVVSALVETPEVSLAAVPLLSEAQRHQLRITFNHRGSGELAEPADPTVAHAMARHAQQRADFPALRAFGGAGGAAAEEALTFGGLWRRAGEVALGLRDRGVRRGDRVALLLPRGVEAALAMLAVWRAGGAFVPVDPGQPEARIQTLLRDAQPALILEADPPDGGESPEPESSPRRVPLSRLENLGAALTSGDTGQAPVLPSTLPLPEAEDLAYVLFTSGSTGTPKGVLIPHRGLAHLVRWHRRYFELEAGQRASQIASLSFDAAQWELWNHLAAGMEVCFVPDDLRSDPVALRRWLGELEVDLTFLPTPLAHLLLAQEEPQGAFPRWLVTGGDRLTRRAPSAAPYRLVNAYGPTEATILSTVDEVSAESAGAPSIGGPPSGMQVYVVDGQLELAPLGAIGELLVGGSGVGRGYLHQPARTAAAFLPDPFGGGQGQRLYRTGDHVRQRIDGRLDFVGRVDDQVKIRGVRIEIGEVESALNDAPGVRTAACIPQPSATGLALVAYWVPALPKALKDSQEAHSSAAESSAAESDTLRHWMAERLPEAMVPSAWICLDELPLTPNGKLDRRALAQLSPPPSAAREGEPLEGEWEQLVGRVWREVLGAEQVCADDEFFALGGHSLLAAQVAARLTEALGREIPLAWLFQATTPRSLGDRLRSLAPQGSQDSLETAAAASGAASGGFTDSELESGAVVAVDGNGGRRGSASYAQERLWFLDLLEPETAVYNVPWGARVRGSLDLRALRRALSLLAQRHEVLRTTLRSQRGDAVGLEGRGDGDPETFAGRVQQVVAPQASAAFRDPLRVVDLSSLKADAAARFAAFHGARPFDLEKGPLWRVALLRQSAEESVLWFCFHHGIFDGTSVPVLLRDLSRLYRGEALEPLPVQYLDYSHWQRRWLESAAGEVGVSDRREQLLAWWKGQLEGLPEAIELPTDRPRPPHRDYRGGMVSATLPAAVGNALDELARGAGATRFMLAAALMGAWLGRLGAGGDLAVGTPVAGRPRPSLEPLLGLFVNTLVLRLRGGSGKSGPLGGPTFRDLLKAARETAVAAFDHQALPFEWLVAELSPVRSRRHDPLFQVFLTVAPESAEAAVELRGGDGSRVQLEPLDAAGGEGEGERLAKFELHLAVAPGADGRWTLSLLYSRALFDTTTVRRALDALGHLATGVVAAPEARLGELSLLSLAQRHQLLFEQGSGSAGPPREALPLPALVQRWAQRQPQRLAVVATTAGGEESWTYGQLLERATEVAQRSRAASAIRQGSDTAVAKGQGERWLALCAGRGPATLATMLGAWLGGAAFLVLDPTQPPARLEGILQEAMANAGELSLWVDDEGAAALDRVELAAGLRREHLQRLDSSPAAAGRAPADSSLGLHLNPLSLAYVLFTSGSTGRPKGVGVSHRSLETFLAWHHRHFPPREDLRVGQTASFAFDVSVWEIWSTLAQGGTLHLAPEELRRDPGGLLQWFGQREIHRAYVATPVADMILPQSWPPSMEEHLEVLWTAGDRLLSRPLEEHRGTVINGYGPTEATVLATWARVEPANSTAAEAPSIGRPLDGYRAWVLDEDLGIAPLGVPGELYLGGEALARGYLGQPGRTAMAFVPDPYSGESGARLYRTGDRVRRVADGRLDFLGRLDAQVQIRGYRVELGEVEAALGHCPAVRRAVVLAPTGPTGSRLVAFLEAARDSQSTTEAWEETVQQAAVGEARQRLPEALVPTAWVVLDALPLSANGKLDRRALESKIPDLSAGAAEAQPLEGPQEQRIGEVWSEVLRLDAIGAEDDFFALGGHSLLAAQVVARLEESLGRPVPVALLFEAPTPRALALALGELESTSTTGRPSLPPLLTSFASRRPEEPPEAGRVGPASYAQERMWFLDRLEPGTAIYNLPWAARLRGPLDHKALASALEQLVDRHEVLRTTFGAASKEVMGDEPVGLRPLDLYSAGAVQRVAAPGGLARGGTARGGTGRGARRLRMRVVDLRGAGRNLADRLTLAHQLAAADASRPFDLATGPLLRATLLQLGPGEAVLLLCMHHTVFDGTSMPVLLRELQRLYSGEGLDALPLQYLDYARWQRAWLEGDGSSPGALKEQLGWWRQRLESLPAAVELPTDRPRPAQRDYRGQQVSAVLDVDSAQALEALARRSGATRFLVLAGLMGAWLRRLGGGDDVAIGTPVAGRRFRELEGLVGLFVNTLVLRMDLSAEKASGPSFQTLLERTRRWTLDAFQRSELPFEALVAELSPVRSLSHDPLFQVFLTVTEEFADEALELRRGNDPQATVAVEALVPQEDEGEALAKFELQLAAAPLRDGRLAFTLLTSRALFDPTTARRLLGWLLRLIAAAVRSPQRPVDELSMLSDAQRHQLLEEQGLGSSAPLRRPTPVPLAVASWAEASPQRVALVAQDGDPAGEGEIWTYGDLARGARALAAELGSRRTAGEEPWVAICGGRRPATVAAMLGAWWSGAAFLILDPTQPPARLARILREALEQQPTAAGSRLPVLADSEGAKVLAEVLALEGAADAGSDSAPPGSSPAGPGLGSGADLGLDRLDPEALEVLPLEALSPALGAQAPPTVSLPPAPRDQQLAYVLFTSGSTGRPKGVGVSHGSLETFLAWHHRRFPRREGLRIGQTASFAFDVSVWEIWSALSQGASLHLASEALRRDPPGLLRWLGDQKLHRAYVATPVADALLPEEWPDSVEDHLEVLWTAGDRLLRRPDPDHEARVINGYGPTEATVLATWAPVRPATLGREAAVEVPDIGRPLDGYGAHVLDGSGCLCPPGVAGELYLGGSALARGYLGQPALTAAAFVPNPFGGEPGERLYRTGDVVRRGVDGRLHFLGRRDGQVKIRGFRIELGEVESVLASQAAVESAVAILLPSSTGPRLAACLLPAAGVEESSSETPSERSDKNAEQSFIDQVRQHAAERLPQPMVPTLWTVVDSLPLTANGKLDRRALRQRVEETAAESGATSSAHLSGRSSGPSSAPLSGPVEEAVGRVWCEVLERAAVGADEDFFALGGHSLLATQVALRLEAALGRPVPLALLFSASTPRRLAAALSAGSQTAGFAEGTAQGASLAVLAPPLRRRERGETPLASYAQERMWFLDQLEPGSAAYHIPWVARLRGPLSLSALESALGALIRRHDSLRSRFLAPGEEGGPPRLETLSVEELEKVQRETWGELRTVDFSGLSQSLEQARNLAAAEASRPFDLARGPLVRALWVRTSPPSPQADGSMESEGLLALTLHHIISDGWSLAVVARELPTLYAAALVGQGSPSGAIPLDKILAPLAVDYSDYALWQRRWLEGGELERQLSWWKQRLEGIPQQLDLPTDRPRAELQSLRGGVETLRCATSWPAFEALARRRGATVFLAALGLVGEWLGRLTGAPRLLLATPIAGRRRPEVEPLVGLFVNTLVLPVEGSPSPELAQHGLEELLDAVRDSVVEAFDHQDLPFERLVQEVVLERTTDRPPLAQVMFSAEAPQAPRLDLPGIEVEAVPLGGAVAKMELSLTLAPGDDEGSMQLAAEYAADLFDATTVRRWLQALDSVLAAAVERPERSVASLPSLSPAQAHQLRFESGHGDAPPPGRFPTVIAALKHFAAATPKAEALVTDEATLSYGQLWERLERGVAVLRRRSVGVETRVAVALADPLESTIALLAVMAAGGAFVALDPQLPAARRQVVEEDAEVRWTVTAPLVTQVVDGAESAAPILDPPRQAAAYLIYTSGSTGRPKGVVVAHGPLADHAAGVARLHRLGAGDRMLRAASYSFDIAMEQLMTPLMAGAAAVLDGSYLETAERFHRRLHRQRVTVADMTAGTWRQWVEELVEGADLPPLPKLRAVVVGSEAMDPDAARAWPRTILGGARLLNAYGPTETVITPCYQPVGVGAQAAPGGTVPIGRPFVGRSVAILDRQLRPLPWGGSGEIVISGSIARGYHRRPAQTADRFRPDPFSTEPGARAYRTGDRGRWRGDGVVEFQGRLDRELKVSGHRVAPEEVENALLQNPHVAEAAVDLRGASLLAWVSLLASSRGAPEAPDGEELRRQLSERLPPYLLPAKILMLDRLPRTAADKVDLRALPDPAQSVAGDRISAPPRDAVELSVLEAFREILDREEVGIHDSFFETGGHSLLALRLLAVLERRFHISLPLPELFSASTPAQLAARLRASREGASAAAADPSIPGPAALVPLARGAQTSPEAGTVVFVHPIGGEVFCYLELARRMRSGERLLGLPAPPLEELPESLEELADRHLRSLRNADLGGGGLRLVGWSLGGALAVEMARRAPRLGLTLDSVALLDPPSVLASEAVSHAPLLARFAADLAALAGRILPLDSETLGDGTTEEQRRAAFQLARSAELLPPDLSFEAAEALFLRFAALDRALDAYRPGPLEVPALVLRAGSEKPRGWSALLADCDVVSFPSADHYSLLRTPTVEAVARLLDGQQRASGLPVRR